MSRSIHTTRRTVARLRRQNFSNSEAKEEALAAARADLRRKRRIKSQVAAERNRPPPPLAGTAISSLPIEVGDEGPFVHHGASPADIRAVLESLPTAATEGIARIHLHLGIAKMDERYREEPIVRDPWTGRQRYDLFPGVCSGPLLGTYHPHTGLISIYAYVYDPGRLPLPRPACELYLRLHALKTLVHEVAHHHDHTQRVRRGRWLADRKENNEHYAEKMEHQWTQEVVLPYLEFTYPAECRALRKWVAHRGGLLLPLEFFAGDPRTTERNGLTRLVLATSSAFESWLEDIATCPTLTASRLAFAWRLHFADAYEHCLAIVDRILASEPAHFPALVCKADTFVHLERLDEAFACVAQVLASDRRSDEAWEIRGDILEFREDWPALLENCAGWETSGKLPYSAQKSLREHRAVAHCALGQSAEMEACCSAHLTALRWRDAAAAPKRIAAFRQRVFRRAGKPPTDPVASS